MQWKTALHNNTPYRTRGQHIQKEKELLLFFSNLINEDSFVPFNSLETEGFEFFTIHRFWQIMDAQTNLWDIHIYVPELDPL